LFHKEKIGPAPHETFSVGKWGEGPLSPLPVKAVAMYDPVVFGRGVLEVLKMEKE
jgi:hypothetical protein